MKSVQTNQEKRSEERITGLEKLFDEAHYEGLAAAFAGIEICRRDKKLAEKMAGKLREKFAFLEGQTPGNAATKHGLDLEMDVLPALRWLDFKDGFTARKSDDNSEKPEQTKRPKSSSQRIFKDATPSEKIVVDWLLKQSYSTKLAIYILSVWINADYEIDGIAWDIIHRFGKEVIEKAANLSGLNQDEIEMTGCALELCTWEANVCHCYL